MFLIRNETCIQNDKEHGELSLDYNGKTQKVVETLKERIHLGPMATVTQNN